MDNPYVKTLEPVWQNLNAVKVNEEKLQELIENMRIEELQVQDWAVPNVQPPIDCNLASWIDFVCWTNTVNFAFTDFDSPWNKFTIEYPMGTIWVGTYALEASFMRAAEEGILVFDSKHMAKISMDEVRYIFRPIDESHQIPLIKDRWRIFRETGAILSDIYDGSWLTLFLDAEFCAFSNMPGTRQGIVEQIVVNFPSFKDTRYYKKHSLDFYKRAQLLVIMYHGRALSSAGKFPLIKDIKDIGPIADYEVPKALKFLGVLEYAPEMEKAILNREVVYKGFSWEVENRLAMSYVMERICDELQINMAQVDYHIWKMGKEGKDPHILVPTTDY